MVKTFSQRPSPDPDAAAVAAQATADSALALATASAAVLAGLDTGGEIKTLLDAVADTNLLTDAERTKIASLPTRLWMNVPALADEVIDSASFGSRANVTTLGDDSELKVTLAPGKYSVRLIAFWFTATADPDIKYALSFTGTVNGQVCIFRRGVAPGAVAGTDNETNEPMVAAAPPLLIPSTALAVATTGVCRLEIEMVIDVATTGLLSLQWAANTSDTDDLTRKFGSCLDYMSLA